MVSLMAEGGSSSEVDEQDDFEVPNGLSSPEPPADGEDTEAQKDVSGRKAKPSPKTRQSELRRGSPKLAARCVVLVDAL